MQSSDWPTFAAIDRPLYRIGVDAVKVIMRLCPRYLRTDYPQAPNATHRLRLTVEGLARIPNARQLVDTWVSVVRYIARFESSYSPGPGEPDEPAIESSDIAKYLTFPRPPAVADTYAHQIGMLLKEEPQLWTLCGGTEGGWRITVSRRARDFDKVESVDDYLAVAGHRDVAMPEASFESFDLVDQGAMTVTVTDTHEVAHPRNVFVVHGRDLQARDAVAAFLRDLDLHPLDWEELVNATGTASPYVGEAVSIAFSAAQAVIVLLTPDDVAQLHPLLQGSKEPTYETEPTGEPRPNVLFEAGMALASHPKRTVLVEVGTLRPASDVVGRHAIRLTGGIAELNALAGRLEAAGCPVKRTNPNFLDTARFSALSALSRVAMEPDRADASSSG